MTEESSETVTLSLTPVANGAKSIRLPFEWIPSLGLYLQGKLTGKQKITLFKEYCDASECQGEHIYFLKVGEKAPVCPYSIMICPKDGYPFKYEKKEQERLRKKLAPLY